MVNTLDASRSANARGPYRVALPENDEPEPVVVRTRSPARIMGIPSTIAASTIALVCGLDTLEEPHRQHAISKLMWQQAEQCIVGESNKLDGQAFRHMQLEQAGLRPYPGLADWPASCATMLSNLRAHSGVADPALDKLSRDLESPSAKFGFVDVREGLEAGRAHWGDRFHRDAAIEPPPINVQRGDPGVGDAQVAAATNGALREHHDAPAQAHLGALALERVPAAVAPIREATLAAPEQVAFIDDKMIIVWATQKAGLRFRIAPLARIGNARDRVLFDDWRDGDIERTESSLREFKLIGGNSFALVVIKTSDGIFSIRIDADGPA